MALEVEWSDDENNRSDDGNGLLETAAEQRDDRCRDPDDYGSWLLKIPDGNPCPPPSTEIVDGVNAALARLFAPVPVRRRRYRVRRTRQRRRRNPVRITRRPLHQEQEHEQEQEQEQQNSAGRPRQC